jgi:hypothetical protein
MFACMDAPLKMYALLDLVSRTQLITYWLENRLLAFISFSKLVQFQIQPPFNILTVPSWLNVKFHFFLIGPKVKILNTFLSWHQFMYRCFQCRNPCELLHASYWFFSLNVQAWLMCYPPQQDLRCPKAVEFYNVSCPQKSLKPLILTLTKGEPASSLYPP